MGNIREGVDELKALGNQHTKYVFDYNPDVLEKIPNKHDDRDYFVKFNCPEFTSLCPKTGQPDFATIYISYIPDKYIVESKSLKLYLFGFRNHGDFHEDCVNIIMTDTRVLLRYGESFFLEADCRSTLTAIMEFRILSGVILQDSDFCVMIWTPKK